MNVTVKALPEDVAAVLKQSAARHSRSLNSHMVAILTEAAKESVRREDMREAMRELDALIAKMPPLPPGAGLDALQADRAGRER